MFRSRTLEELRTRRPVIGRRRALVGFDGFVDTIVTPVAERHGPGEDFSPFATIAEFGRRVLGAAGKSLNLELQTRREKLGGNGPIMARALLAQGVQVTCIGALGEGEIHPVFADLARRGRAVSLCAPALTTALEFSDGKLMLGQMRSLDDVTPARIAAVMGARDYGEAVAAADLVAPLNWTMIPHLTAVFTDLVENILPALPPRPDRIFYFDLADPEKRAAADLREALGIIAGFEKFGRVTLALNLKEAQQVHAALGLKPVPENEAGFRALASEIRARLDLAVVTVHPKESAACATREGVFWVPGPYAEKPLISTGAGDHFNAGFATGQLLGVSPEACLVLGVATSGHYVRTAQSPSLDDLENFLTNWR